MKKVILIIAALLVMASCGRVDRFVTIEKEGLKTHIVYDKETNVEYVRGPFGRMCVLVDADGKPLIYEGKNQ